MQITGIHLSGCTVGLAGLGSIGRQFGWRRRRRRHWGATAWRNVFAKHSRLASGVNVSGFGQGLCCHKVTSVFKIYELDQEYSAFLVQVYAHPCLVEQIILVVQP